MKPLGTDLLDAESFRGLGKRQVASGLQIGKPRDDRSHEVPFLGGRVEVRDGLHDGHPRPRRVRSTGLPASVA